MRERRATTSLTVERRSVRPSGAASARPQANTRRPPRTPEGARTLRPVTSHMCPARVLEPAATHRPPDAGHHPAITFLSGDLSDAVATATRAAAGKNVIVFGASLAVRCLHAGLLDEIVIHLVPVLLGDGVRLIDAPDLGPVALERTLVATSGQITDLWFALPHSGKPVLRTKESGWLPAVA